LVKSSNEAGYHFSILDAVMDVNLNQKTIMFPRIMNHFGGDLKGKRIALWGLAFKPNTDDIREAPALYNIEKLVEKGATVIAYDPEAMDNVKKVIGDKIEYANNQYEAIKDADALFIATEWSVFRNPNFDKVASLLKNKVIFDGRNLYEVDHMTELGFQYFSIGR